MNIFSAEAISKHYGLRSLFDQVSFGLMKGERLGVIGVNGSGKTSLLRIVAGLETPDTGKVVFGTNVHVAYLPQAPQLDERKTVLEAVFASDSPTIALLRSYEQLSRALEQRPSDQTLLADIGSLTAQMDALGAWEAEAAARSIIDELGLATLIDQPVGQLSGGQRKRVAMAQILVDRPDLLILDEPTNHIDTDTITWLEDYLARSSCALLLVTHDRYFLDRLTTRMLEIDRGVITAYSGNYERFLEQKAERLQREAAAEEARQNLLRRELAWLRRGARARTTKQKAHVERVHQLRDQTGPVAQGQVALHVGQHQRLGKRVIEVQHIAKAYSERQLIADLSLEVRPGDRIGIIGPNGSGKTTLLNILTSRIQPDRGVLTIGETVHIGYYDQETIGLDESLRVIDYIREAAEMIRGPEGALMAATQMLERFLFSSEQQWAYISTLSGGERRRLYLLRQLISGPNVLILDEPTNDLDLQTLHVLEDYLDDFPGAVIAVSHDRYFLDRVAQRTLAFGEGGQINEYPGGYSAYLTYRPARIPQELPAPRRNTVPPKAAGTPTGRLSTKEKRELSQLEERIAELEQQRDSINVALNQAGDDYTVYGRLAAELAAVETRIEETFTHWASLAERA